MSRTRSISKLSRRGLLKGAGLAGAAAVGAPLATKAQTAGQPDGPPRPVGPVPPNPRMEQGIPAEMPILQGSGQTRTSWSTHSEPGHWARSPPIRAPASAACTNR